LNCPELKEALVIDNFASRLRLMRLRIAAWSNYVLKIAYIRNLRLVMITLTYKKAEDYKAGDIRDFMKLMKKKLDSKLVAFAWVAEMQKRGAVHYHIILAVEKGTRIPRPDSSRMWPHGMSRIETARTPYYLLSYTGKEHQKDLGAYPKGCRLYAVSVRGAQKELMAYDELPGYEEIADDGTRAKWIYVGSSVTLDYAKQILVPEESVVK